MLKHAQNLEVKNTLTKISRGEPWVQEQDALHYEDAFWMLSSGVDPTIIDIEPDKVY